MEQKNLSTINLSRKQLKDVEEFCKLNKIENVEEFLFKCFIGGYEIEKYGLLQNSGGSREKWVEKEVIVEKRVEVPVEVIIEKPIIEYVEVEKEIIKEIPREVIVEKIVEVTKEIPVEKIVERTVEVVKEVPVDRVVIQEVIKEVPVEKIITKTEYITDDSKVTELVEELERVRNLPPTTVEIEVIKEVEVSVEVIKEVIVEVPVEVIKEVVVEKTTTDTSKQKALEETIQKLRGELQLKNKEIQDLNNTIKEIQNSGGGLRGVLLDGSNLNRTINRR
jgi:hypothetical protein